MEMHAKESRKLHEVEKDLFSSLLALGLSLLSYHIEHVKLLTAQQGVPTDSHGKKMQHKGEHSSPYFSVFARLEISQIK